jgi:hypothetical protein
MLTSKQIVSTLRRDVSFVWHAMIVVVFVSFGALALGAAFIDLLAIRP